MAVNDHAPQGAPVRFAPAYHRPWLRYITDPGESDGGEGEGQEFDWKGASRKWESRAKSNLERAEAAEQELATVKAAQDQSKSESDKTSERITLLEKQLADSRVEATRARVQAKYGIADEDAAVLLTGSDEKSLVAQAERLAARAKQGNRVLKEGRPVINTNDGDDGLRDVARSLFGSGDNE